MLGLSVIKMSKQCEQSLSLLVSTIQGSNFYPQILDVPTCSDRTTPRLFRGFARRLVEVTRKSLVWQQKIDPIRCLFMHLVGGSKSRLLQTNIPFQRWVKSEATKQPKRNVETALFNGKSGFIVFSFDQYPPEV